MGYRDMERHCVGVTKDIDTDKIIRLFAGEEDLADWLFNFCPDCGKQLIKRKGVNESTDIR